MYIVNHIYVSVTIFYIDLYMHIPSEVQVKKYLYIVLQFLMGMSAQAQHIIIIIRE